MSTMATGATTTTRSNQSRSRHIATTILIGCLVIASIVSTCCDKKKQQQHHEPQTNPVSEPEIPPDIENVPPSTERRSLWTEAEEAEMIEEIKKKLIPHQFEFIDNTTTLAPHQFLHLHHMKTGGTSMDHLMKCCRGRLERVKKWDVPYYSIHECSVSEFRKCVANETHFCRGKMKEAAVMSFCAPLKHLDSFGWKEKSIKALTVLRHPVGRVWSMFRFQTKQCYQCMNLTDIYEKIDNNDLDEYGEDSLCLKQLMNHETINMLRKDFPEDATEDEMVAEAINNMKNFFTVIGLTERLKDTYDLLGHVFPWMALKIEGSSNVCRLPHDNSTPKNNHCLPATTHDKYSETQHWELPDVPDEDTVKAIEAHNKMDMRLYEAAVQYFELQMRAFEMGDEE